MSVPSINEARNLGKKHGLYGVVILAITEDGEFGITSWGKTKLECAEMKGVGDLIEGLIKDRSVGAFRD